MFKQFKYAVRTGLNLRLFALGLTVILNLGFGILGSLNIYGEEWKIAAITFSSLNLCALFIMSVIADNQNLCSVYSAPMGYTTMLTPVKRWKILFSRIVIITVFDLISWTLGIIGIVWQTWIFEKFQMTMNPDERNYIVWAVILLILYYFFVITLIFLAGAIEKSLFYAKKLGKLFGVITFIALFYAVSLVDFILLLFAPADRFKVFFSVSIYPEFNAATITLYILLLFKIAVCLIGASKLIERRINI
jgi:hypothetical protein